MADVADGRLRSDAGAGAPFHCAGKRAGARLRPETFHGRDAAALWGGGSAPGQGGVRRRCPVGRGFCHSRLGLAPPPPQGRAFGLPPRQTLVRDPDGATRGEAGDGSEAGLSWFFGPGGAHSRRPSLHTIPVVAPPSPAIQATLASPVYP